MLSNSFKKALAVAVILLFIGLAFAPSINANISKASIENELVEFTTEVCGLDGGNHTVQLTKEEAEEVDRLFESIRERLNATESREEAEDIFNEAVVELDKYGLLGGLSVKQAQWLMTQRLQNKRIMRFMERVIDRNHHLSSNDFFCLIAGNTHNLNFFSPLYPLYQYLWQNFDQDHTFVVIAMFMSHFSPAIYTLRPLKIFSQIAFGHSIWTFEHGTDYYPAKGWVISFSLVGKTEWDGESLWGQISVIEPNSLVGWLIQVYYYIGVKGFSGINIYNFKREENFFLGTALQAKLDYKLPKY